MELNVLDQLDPRELGKELQAARKKRGMTQEEAAQILGVARTTLTAIEKGERRLQPPELITLARAYQRPVSDFVRARPAIEASEPQFRGPYRATDTDKEQIMRSVAELEELARNYLELEEITQTPLVRKYPAERDLSGLKPEIAAEAAAIEERLRLGLGDGPLPLLRDLLENEVGLRIFYLPLASRQFSAIYLYDEKLGGCIAVNQAHPEERRRWSLAHDYGHFLAHRRRPAIFAGQSYQRIPNDELFADYFALYFLMPTDGLRRRFLDLRRVQRKVTMGDLYSLAHYYGVSLEAFTRRLEDLRLIPIGTGENLRERGPKVQAARQQLGLAALPEQAQMLPTRYQHLAVSAFEQELVTEGQFAWLLRVDRLEARHIAEVLQQEASHSLEATPLALDLTQTIDV